jgi:hypothetical protein
MAHSIVARLLPLLFMPLQHVAAVLVLFPQGQLLFMIQGKFYGCSQYLQEFILLLYASSIHCIIRVLLHRLNMAFNYKLTVF